MGDRRITDDFFVYISKHVSKPNNLMNIVPEIVIDSKPNNYSKNAELLGNLIEGETGNQNFLTPSPPLNTLTTAQTNLLTAITKYGPKGNRTGRAALLDLRQKSATAYSLIKAEVQYITGVASQAAGNDMLLMVNIMGTCGLDVRTSRTPQGLLGQVRNIHQVNSGGLSRNQVDWRWSKPLGVTNRNNVKFNKVFRATANDLTAATLVATPTKAKFIDTNNTGATITYIYWFLAVTAAGDSTVSEPVSITLVSA